VKLHTVLPQLLAMAGLWSLSSPANHVAELAEIVIGVLVFHWR